MAALFDAASVVDDGGNNVTTLSLTTLTVGSQPNRVLVAVVGLDATGSSISAVWDSGGSNQTMTPIAGASGDDGGGNNQLTWFGLVNPVSGNKTLKASWTGVTAGHLGAMSFYNADQTGGSTTFAHGAFNTGSGTSVSVTVTSATGNAAVGVNFSNAAQLSAPNQSVAWTDSGGLSGDASIGQYAAGAASVVFSSTLSKSKNWSSAGFDILAATPSSPSGPGAAFSGPPAVVRKFSAVAY